jgi:ubiquinone/menaquinone biosynthesis C-methylase UbiE
MTKSIFDEKAATWDDNPRRMALTRAIAKGIRENIPLTADMSMLDFGCGTGALSVQLAECVGSIHAVDASSGMIDELRRKLDGLPGPAAKIAPAVLTGPIEENLQGTWDLICTAMVLHHIDDTTGILRHFTGCLRPGGYLALADLYTEDGSFHGEEVVPHNGFDPQTLAGVLEEAGLVQTRITPALSFTKLTDSGPEREFSVFLLTAKRESSA